MKSIIEVTHEVEVEVPDTLLTEEFMAEFRKHFYPFTTAREHLEHLAQLNVRGLADNHSFIEGYGKADEIGINFS